MSDKKHEKQPSQEKQNPEKKNKDLPVDDRELTDEEAKKVAGGGCGCSGMGQDPVSFKKR